MANPQDRKRQRSDEPSTEDCSQDHPPAKKTKTRRKVEVETSESWVFAPEFWDSLSKIWLTERALEELDRRTRTQRSHPTHLTAVSEERTASIITTSSDLVRFARHGGPDLCDLRGHPHPTSNRPISVIMGASPSPQRPGTQSMDPASTLPTLTTTDSKKSKTPYDRNFGLHLTDHGIHPTYSSQKPDLTETRAAMAAPRPSLSPSHFSEGVFEAFQESDARAKDEDDVLANVIPTIFGTSYVTQASARNTLFGNLEPLMDKKTVPAKPDIYYGTYPEKLARSVRNEIGPYIIPSTMVEKPLAPNLFVEVKGPSGDAAVATRQARYYGAIGSRAMQSLQNYGKGVPQYDGRAYTYSSTYLDGMLKLYAHHATAPSAPGGQPEYHMTQVDAWGMTGNRNTFIQGATALRNIRDLAQQHRDNFIQTANARASQAETAYAVEDGLIGTGEIQQAGGSSPDELPDCEEVAEPHNGQKGLSSPPLHQSLHGFSQAQASQCPVDAGEDTQGHSKEDRLLRATTEPPAGFATSSTSRFTSTFSSTHGYEGNSKRQRLRNGLPSTSHRCTKHDATTDPIHPKTINQTLLPSIEVPPPA